MSFVQLWLQGIVRPTRAFDQLKGMPAPHWGLAAVLIRFVVTALTTTLALLLLGREPFWPSYLTFLPPERYYAVLVFAFPIFGLVAWLLMGSIAHLALRLAGRQSDVDQILNIAGMAMLIPMPVLWLWDWAMIALDAYQVATMAPSHALVQVWEAALGAVGFRRILGLGPGTAIALAVAINLVFILMGSLFSR
jgi:hypothetical protein